MKALILSIVMLTASVSTVDAKVLQTNTNITPIVEHISKKYKVKKSNIRVIVKKVSGLVDAKFPRKDDVLAIIEIESNFKTNAKSSSGAKGLMQVLYKKTNSDSDNILAGVELLREYRLRLGSDEAAVHAYNVGIGAFIRGKRSKPYYKKYLEAKSQLREHLV